MATIQNLPDSEAPATSRDKINDNFGALNTELIAATSAVAGKEATGTAAGLLAAHVAAADPHTAYALESDVTSSLAGKAATSHTHATSEVTGLDSALSGKAASSHSHATSDVTGLDSALSGKAATSHSHATSDVTGLDSALLGKAASSHTHATSDVTGLDAALAGKASSSHTHGTSDITGLGTEVATALAVNVGSAGAPVLFNGAGGTPSSLTLTNATGLPAGAVVVPALSAHTFASTLDIALTAAPQRRSLALTGNITFTGSGYTDGREAVYFVAGDTVARTLDFPSDWVFVGVKPTELAADKAAVFSLECTSASATGVRCAWGVQP